MVPSSCFARQLPAVLPGGVGKHSPKHLKGTRDGGSVAVTADLGRERERDNWFRLPRK